MLLAWNCRCFPASTARQVYASAQDVMALFFVGITPVPQDQRLFTLAQLLYIDIRKPGNGPLSGYISLQTVDKVIGKVMVFTHLTELMLCGALSLFFVVSLCYRPVALNGKR